MKVDGGSIDGLKGRDASGVATIRFVEETNQFRIIRDSCELISGFVEINDITHSTAFLGNDSVDLNFVQISKQQGVRPFISLRIGFAKPNGAVIWPAKNLNQAIPKIEILTHRIKHQRLRVLTQSTQFVARLSCIFKGGQCIACRLLGTKENLLKVGTAIAP